MRNKTLLLFAFLTFGVLRAAVDPAALIDLRFDALDADGGVPDRVSVGEIVAMALDGGSLELETGEEGAGMALVCDGTGAAARVSGEMLGALSRDGALTISLRFLASSLGTEDQPKYLLMAGDYPGPGSGFGVALAGPHTLQWIRYSNGGWNSQKVDLNKEMETERWHQLALVFLEAGDGEYGVKVYLDAELVAETQMTAPIGPINRETHLYIGGCGSSGRNFSGLVDSVEIFDVDKDYSADEASDSKAASTRAPPLAPAADSVSSPTVLTVRPAAQSVSDENPRLHPELGSAWADPYFPYRLELTLAEKLSGRFELDISLDELCARLSTVCPEIVDPTSFAFEKVLLVDPRTGQSVGRFVLRPEGDNLIKNSDFGLDEEGKLSSWIGFQSQEMEVREETLPDGPASVLSVSKEKITNTGVKQPLSLMPGNFYLLEGWMNPDVSVGGALIDIANPAKKLFLSTTGSYVPAVKKQKQWTWQQALYLPDMKEGVLRLGTGFAGKALFARPELRRARWELVVDLPEATNRLDLYYVPRAGHKLTVPTEALIENTPGSGKVVGAEVSGVNHADLNLGGFSGVSNHVEFWTVPSVYPLRQGYLEFARAGTAADQLELDLFQGGSRSVLIAVKCGTPLLQVLGTRTSLPLEVQFERVAPIPVFDGPHPSGKLQQVRYDALMACDDPLIPPVEDGIHVIAVTIKAPFDAPPGKFEGAVLISAQDQVPTDFEVRIPISVRVAPVQVKPMNHFGTSFGAALIMIRLTAANNHFMKGDGVSVADFHGYGDLKPRVGTTEGEKARDTLRTLARKYFQKFFDNNLVPHGLAQFSDITYEVKNDQDGSAPTLEDWDFTGYDNALDEMVLANDAPFFTINHTNGALMDRLRLRNGMTYSFRDPEGNIPWTKLSKPEFYKLVGEFYNDQAAHLDEKGVLDRAFVLIDESDPSTYEVIRDYVEAVRATPFGKQISFAHTTYKPGTYTREDPNGGLLLDGVLDIPMPANDEHAGVFDPEANNRLKTRGDQQWVYYVQSDHFDLNNAGLSTVITPLKLNQFGANGWLCWGSFLWSMPYPTKGPEFDNEQHRSGPVVNPWLNPFYHHGPGSLSFFYPPDPRGLAQTPTDKIIPSYRLNLMSEGIQTLALLKVLEKRVDDAGQKISVNGELLQKAQDGFASLCAPNPVQWYTSLPVYENSRDLLYDSISESATSP